ncbi:MAG TPA: HPF/RaiA family ribosome-associated protein [Gammaproteobacteria bacterium]|nr:HPF/RaiA family ribosome-associated protein [Gammaproteobacteria bacterium]
MQTPLQVTFRESSDPTGAIHAKIEEHVGKLDKFHKNIIGCQVVVEAPHHNHQKGNLYKVRVNLSVPGHKFVASSEARHNHAHEDVYVAVRDAFEAIARQLESLIHIQQGHVKVHAVMPKASVSVLMPENDCGRFVTEEGHDIYFHRNSVDGDAFDRLVVGSLVEFEYEMGDDGLQATFVKLLY